MEESIIIDLDITTKIFDNIAIRTFTAIDLTQSDDFLPLMHPELIDWDPIEPMNIPIFENDDAIVNFLCCDEPNTSENHKSHNGTLGQEGFKYFNCKIENRSNRCNGENHSMTTLDL